MNSNNFYNVAASFWGKNLLGCGTCSLRDTTLSPQNPPVPKPKKEHLPVDSLNTSSNANNISQISQESNPNLDSTDLTSLSMPIKFSGNPKGKAWTKEEDEMLREAVKFYNGKNWKQIASKVPGRSSTQCSQRWRRIQPYKNRFPWTNEEDQKLSELVYKYGQNWSIIASSLNGRTGKQVRERYLNNLDPTLNRNKFSLEEDEKIIEMYTQIGPKWKEMTREFSGRTENMIKNRFYSHIKKKMLLKYPQKYKKALEKAQTEVSLNNYSSPHDPMRTSYGASEKISAREDFSELSDNFRQKFQQLELQAMEFLEKEFKNEVSSTGLSNNSLGGHQNVTVNKDTILNSNQNTHDATDPLGNHLMELEDVGLGKINDGFLNLYRNSKETPTKNHEYYYKSIFSPMNHKLSDIAFDQPMIKQEIELDHQPKPQETNYFKFEGELNESKNAIINSFFNNIKEFDGKDVFGKGSLKIEEEPTNSKAPPIQGETLLNQKHYLLSKKARLETMIKEIAGKIQHHTNSQHL